MTFLFAGRYHEIFFINGRIAKNTDVTIRLSGTNTGASLFTDRLKTSQLPNSVVRTDEAGNLTFWTDPGLYDLLCLGVTVLSVEVTADPSSVVPAPATPGVANQILIYDPSTPTGTRWGVSAGAILTGGYLNGYQNGYSA